MRITWIGPVPPQRGGIAQHGARVVEALVDAGHEVHVEGWAAPYPRWLYPGDQHDESAPGPATGRTDHLAGACSVRRSLRWWNPAGWWAAGRRARSSDLIVFPWWSTVQAPAMRLALGAAGSRPHVAVMVHNVVPHERHVADLALTRMVLRRCDQAVVHTSPLATELAAVAPGVEVTITPHPPNVILTPQPLPPGPPWRLLVFGHVRDYKGLDLALDTVAELRGRDVPVEMTVAGQFWGPLEPWQERLEVAGLGGIVSLKPGYIADADLDELFAGHHLVLSAYRSATTSGVVPLAASAGRASVVTPVGGLAEQVIDGVSGIVSVGTNPHEIADAIGRAISMVQSLTGGATAIPTGWNGVAMALAKNPLHR